MSITENITKYAAYNIWANQILSAYVQKTCSDAEIEQTIMNSFPSIRKTMAHIWDAEVLWIHRLDGISMDYFPSSRFEGNNLELFQNLNQNSILFYDKVLNMNQLDLETEITYMTLTYGGSTQNRYDMIQHCMNHSTYHRGQVIMMLRQLGHTELPHLDFMLYLIERKKATV